MSDARFDDLLERARGGDAEAVMTLLEPHLPSLTAFIRLRFAGALRPRESVADLVQSVCREAIQAVAGVRAGSAEAFRRWLFTVALHKVIQKQEYHRAQKRDAGRDRPGHVEPSVGDGALLDCYASICTPSREAMAREEIERIEAALAQLSDEQRQVLVEARLIGLSHAEIAQRLGRTPEAVRQLLLRARARLAVLLG